MEAVKEKTVNEKAKLPGYAWFIFGIVFLASLCAPINQLKAPPVADLLMASFGMDVASFGLLMSVFSIMGVILAFPAGFITKALGLKKATILSLLVLIIGSLIGTFAPNIGTMLAGRFVEGIGVGLISISAPAAITEWFPKSRRGLALGIWTAWYPLGTVIIFNIGPTMAQFGGWQTVWWFGTILSIVALVLFAIFFRLPKEGEIIHEDNEGEALVDKSAGSMKRGFQSLKNYKIWLLGITFFIFNVMAIGVINTYYPTYLAEEAGYTMAMSSTVTTTFTICSIFAGILAGKIVDITKSLKWPIIIGYLGSAVIMAFLFNISDMALVIGVFIVLGITASLASAPTRIAAPELMKSKEDADMAMAVLSFWQNLGAMVGPIVFGAAVVAMGWSMSALVLLVPGLVIAAVIVALIKMR